jgi:fermentation-respiration switch protein FrsA (DUF1100 family)
LIQTITFLLATGLGLYLAGLAVIAFGQRKLMYFPYVREAAPAAVGLPDAKILYLRTDDGETLLAWFIAPAPGRPLILYFHGNANALGELGPRFQQLTATGAGVLGVEYRGYAGSTGSPSEDGLLRDGEAAYAEAIARGFSPKSIVAMGESLGSGVAVALAARHPVGAVVLDAPYSATVDVAQWRFPMFPVRWLMRDQFRSDQKIAKVCAPVLIVHGTADWTIPIRFGEKLFALANAPKDFIRLQGAGHPALHLAIPQVLTWIDKALAPTIASHSS